MLLAGGSEQGANIRYTSWGHGGAAPLLLQPGPVAGEGQCLSGGWWVQSWVGQGGPWRATAWLCCAAPDWPGFSAVGRRKAAACLCHRQVEKMPLSSWWGRSQLLWGGGRGREQRARGGGPIARPWSFFEAGPRQPQRDPPPPLPWSPSPSVALQQPESSHQLLLCTRRLQAGLSRSPTAALVDRPERDEEGEGAPCTCPVRQPRTDPGPRPQIPTARPAVRAMTGSNGSAGGSGSCSLPRRLKVPMDR